MPLVRTNNYNLLTAKFEVFCSNLEFCIRRDSIAVSPFFTNNINFNAIAVGYSADVVSDGLYSVLASVRQPRFESRITTSLERFVNGSTFNSPLANMKETILCAFELTNQGSRDRINKQQLYTFLFCMGFPIGLIAKIILNGNVGGVRNGVLQHKEFAGILLSAFYNGRRLDNLKKGFLGNENVGSLWQHRFFAISMICYKVGGMNLLNKFVNLTDQRDLLISLQVSFGADTLIKRVLCDDNEDYYQIYRSNVQYLFDIVFASQRGQRRTGQSLSRNAVQERRRVISSLEQQAPSSPTPQQDVVILSTPTDESIGRSQIPTSRTTRTKVRDIPFTNTFGIEIEGSFMRGKVDSVGSTSADHWNALKKAIRDADFTADVINSRGEKTGQGKLGVRQEGYNATNEEKAYWKYKGDGSVYGGDPYEFASPILKGKNGIEQVKIICSAMRQAGFYSNATAGLHIHLGAKDLELDTFKNVIYNYTKFEPLIEMMFTSDRRWSNPYYAQSYSTINNWESKLSSARNFQELQSMMMGGSRYYTVNLYAFDRFGTIEFRKLMGTNDDRLIIFFTYYLHYLLEASKRKKLSNFNLKGLQDILPAWAFTYFVDRVRNTSGYDIAYGYDVGQGGSTYTRDNTYTRGGDPMETPLRTRRGSHKSRSNPDFS
jgi:hypothetical protein